MTNTLFAVMESYNDHIVWQKWQENTGVDVTFEHPAAGMAKEEFGLLMSEDVLPDIIQGFDNYYTGGILAGYEDDIVLDITDLVKEYAPDYYALISQSEEIWRQFTVNDRILSFNSWCEELNEGAMMWTVRQDWLDEFGLKAEDMTTYDAIETYFQKILENKPGVTPLELTVTAGNQTSTNNVIYWGYNIYPSWYQVDGKVKYYDDGDMSQYRAFLERMHSWYDKGYLSKDFASYKTATARANFSAGATGCICVNVGPAYSDADTSGIPIVKTPFWKETADQPINVYFPDGTEKNGTDATVITVDCKDPITAVKFLNYGYTDEGMILSNWGVEGVSYTTDENGQRHFTEQVVNNPNYGTSLTMYIYRIHKMPNRRLSDCTANPNITKRQEVVDTRLQYMSFSDTMNGDYFLPSGVSLTAEENSERSSIMTNVNTYIDEMRNKFITGAVELNDENWNTFLATLDSYGLTRAVEITQNAYDRYLGK